MEFKKDVVFNNKNVINCKTQEQSDMLLDWAHKNGRKWKNGDAYNKENSYSFLEYNEETCLNIARGSYGRVDFYQSEMNKNIIPFEKAVYGGVKDIVKKVREKQKQTEGGKNEKRKQI